MSEANDDGAAGGRRSPVRGTVNVLAQKEAVLTQVDRATIAWREAMIAADRASQELTARLEDADGLNAVRPRTVTDQELSQRVNALIPQGTTAFNRPLRMSLMTIRRRLGKAPGK